MIPDPRERPTLSVEEAGAIVGLGRSSSYEQARRFLATDGREGLPVLAYGRTLRVPTAMLLGTLGLGIQQDPREEGPAPTGPSIDRLPTAAQQKVSRGSSP